MDTIFNSIDEALEDYRNGIPIIVMDDEDRENEGDLIISGKHLSESITTLYQQYTTGIFCAVIDEKKSKRLDLPPMCRVNTDNHQTAFTVSCDAINTTTGVSSKDRTATIKALCNESIELRKPGHIFPLISKPNGLQDRRGHTEAGYDLNRLTYPETFDKEVAFISELMNIRTGRMMNLLDAKEFATNQDFKIISVQQIYEYGVMDGLYGLGVWVVWVFVVLSVMKARIKIWKMELVH